ncbi:MAG: hypothetical protein AAB481_02110 [Patescibacteria group bacterium]
MDVKNAQGEFFKGNPDVASFVERNKLLDAPTIVYGKANKAIRWGDDPWEVEDTTLAKLVLYSKSLSTLYSDNGPFHPLPFVTVSAKNWGDSAQMNDPYFFHSQSKFYEFWVGDSSSLLKRELLANKPEGSVDVCMLEQNGSQTGMWYGWQPAHIVAQARGDIKLFTYIQLTQNQAEQIKQEITKHPQRPHQILQSIFPNAFLPAVESENLRRVFDQYGQAELDRLSHKFPNKDLRHINSELGINLTKEGEVLEPSEAFARLQPFRDVLVMTALGATKLARVAPQQSLWFGDVCDVSALTTESVRPRLELLRVA